MKMICLDFEGVLVPEIWQEVAKAKNVPELMRTTKDEPDYSKLMRWRLEILRKNNITIQDIHDVVEGLEPYEGAREFLDSLRSQYQVAILTDSFYEFIEPLRHKVGLPMTFAHRLISGADGMIEDFKLRINDQKTISVKSFQESGFSVIAAGDSHNDLGMMNQAEAGILFRSTEQIILDNPDLPSCTKYEELRSEIDEAAETIS